jgi:hypothetical protein
MRLETVYRDNFNFSTASDIQEKFKVEGKHYVRLGEHRRQGSIDPMP